MARGLNESQRSIIRAMVERGESGEAVRNQIDDMATSDSWDYNKNAQLITELAARWGYYETAKYLEYMINH